MLPSETTRRCLARSSSALRIDLLSVRCGRTSRMICVAVATLSAPSTMIASSRSGDADPYGYSTRFGFGFPLCPGSCICPCSCVWLTPASPLAVIRQSSLTRPTVKAASAPA